MGSGCSSSSKSTFSSSTNNPQTKSCSSLGNGAGEQRVTWELRTEDELVEAEGPCVGSTGKVEAMDKGICRSVETDEELQILDDLLAESQDCLSWKTSTSKAQMLTSTGHTTSPQANLCGGKKHNSETIWIAQEPAQLPPASSPCQNSNFRQCMKDTSSKPVVITRNTQDIENNNLPYPFQDAHVNTEKSPVLKYNKSEEALMDFIEYQYSE